MFGLQLYWRTDQDAYDDSNSVRAAGEVGVSEQEICLVLPRMDVPPAGLRLDIADRPGFLRIHSISLLEKSGAELWRWPAEDLSIVDTVSNELVEFSSGPNRWWLSTGDDPFIELPVPPGALAHSSEGTLALRIGWPMSPDFFIAERLISQETKLWSTRCQELERQLRSAAARLAPSSALSM